ncbi:3-dehydroquinate synthase [bacterium]|nr:3-dehydroquinate synthase [bacterium]
MINLKVELGDRSYPIFIGEEVLPKLGEMCRLYNLGQKVVVITDKKVEKMYGAGMFSALQREVASLEVASVPVGEKSKSLKTAERIITRMLEIGCDRQSTVIGFGGGVVGDLAGFVASIFKRGVHFVQVPTTLLAQVDASVGGKTAVNHPFGKNLIGTFYQPHLVWMDLALLRSLPKREMVCGLGEVVKYGVIRDPELFHFLEQELEKILARDTVLLQEIVRRCCEIKAEIVSEDERENSGRMILNFGHTVGHAFEAALGYKRLAHGEAVLLGMLVESKIALDLKLLDPPSFKRIVKLIRRIPLPRIFGLASHQDLIGFMKHDKKTIDGRLRLVLPKSIGEVAITETIDVKTIRSALGYLAEGF